MPFTLTIDLANLSYGPSSIPHASVTANTQIKDTTGKLIFDNVARKYPLTDGKTTITLPALGGGVLPSTFGFMVQVGNRKVTVPAQASGSTHDLVEFLDVLAAPVDASVETVLLGEIANRQAGDTAGLTAAESYTDAQVGALAKIKADTDHVLYVDGDIPGGFPIPAQITSRNLGHSYWSQPLPYRSAVAPSSATLVNSLVQIANMGVTNSPIAGPYAAPFNTLLLSGPFALAVYTMDHATPRSKVYSLNSLTGDWQTQLDQGVPVPDPTLLPDGTIAPSGTDGSVIIIDSTTFEAWELWQFRPATTGTPAGYAWQCHQGGYMADIRKHPGFWATDSYWGGGIPPRRFGNGWGVAAIGMAYTGTLLKAEDFYGSAITHPISMVLPLTGGSPSSYLPATRFDTHNGTNTPDATANAYRVPEGARFRLPQSFDIASYVATKARPSSDRYGSDAPTLTKLLVCLRDYGVIVSDSGDGCIGFSAEADKVYGTKYHPFMADEVPNWGNFGQQIPWASLQQVAVPTVDISSPNGTIPADPFMLRSWSDPGKTQVGGLSSQTPSWPKGIQPGDTIYAFAYGYLGSDPGFVPPSGWSEVKKYFSAGSFIYCWRHTYAAGDVAPAWPVGSYAWNIAYVAVAGAYSTPEDASAANESFASGSAVALPVTGVRSGNITIVAAGTYSGGDTTTATIPANAMQLFESQSFKIFAFLNPATGSNSQTITFNAAQNAVYYYASVTVRPGS